MINEISTNEIVFDQASFIDPIGKVFHWKNGVYRGIKESHSEFFRNLIQDKNFSRLTNVGLIETTITDYSLNGFDLILSHKKIPFVSVPFEWPSSMLRDAGLLTLDIESECLQSGLALKDGHPWNVLYDFCTPKFIDIGSIVKSDGYPSPNWFIYEFKMRFVYSLLLNSHGYNYFSNLMFLDPVKFPSKNAIFKLLFHRPLNKWVSFWLQDRKTENLWKINKLSAVKELKNQLSDLPLNFGLTEWTNYSSVDTLDNLEKNEFTNKGKLVLELIGRVKPKSVIDIGSNKGIYSELIARNGVPVVATDIDETSISQLYLRAKKQGLSILPLRVDISKPTPAHGPWNLFSEAKNRLKCEFALALAISHHLVLRQGLSFEKVSSYLSSFTEKWLLVEFVDAQDMHVSRWIPKPEPWYTLENFISALSKNFKEINVFDSYVKHRYLIFCQK